MAHDAPWRRLYPFAPHYLQLDGPRLHYLDEGAGQPLLMVHGNPTWSFYWRHLVAGFRERYRVVVPDHVGCGLSDKPQDYRYTLERHIENLVSLVEHLDLQRLTLLVHDWGGAIGLGAACRVPHRIARLVLFNTGAFPPPYVPWRIRLCRTPLVGTWTMRQLNLFARAALSMATSQPQRMTAEVRAGLLAPYDSWDNRVAIDRFVHDIPTSPRHPTWTTLARIEQELDQFREHPTLLIWGMRDWCFRPRCLTRFESLFPHADVHRLEDAGHYVVEDAHERILPIVGQFLERGGASREESSHGTARQRG